MKQKYFTIILISLLLLQPVFAGYFDDWYKWLHVPPEYTQMPDLLYFFLLPFLAVFAVVWGILTKINIFGGLKNINMLLSLVFAIALIYYGWVFKVVHFLLSFGTTVSFIAFAIMFFVGTKLFAEKKITTTWKGSALKQLKLKERELKDLQEDLRRAPDDKKDKIRNDIKAVETELKNLRDEIDQKPKDE